MSEAGTHPTGTPQGPVLQGLGLGNMAGDFTGKPWLNPFNLADIKSAPWILATILTALYVPLVPLLAWMRRRAARGGARADARPAGAAHGQGAEEGQAGAARSLLLDERLLRDGNQVDRRLCQVRLVHRDSGGRERRKSRGSPGAHLQE